MGETYTVKQGDYLAKIAAQFGFTNLKTIWDDPQNAKLKELRKNPNVLFPGDQLFRTTPYKRAISRGSTPSVAPFVTSDDFRTRSPTCRAVCTRAIDTLGLSGLLRPH